mmetsp:Transcript_25723/g.35679  ORF Transcript_25723/g.35679 Transcript_25723/m.35679 type:complete len:749 (-) Transcript_25723:139-2385(-)|eukprot:CAMPEP_0201496080 /NCGR_PEP_ID=MMETSP0151_2-20130828/57822_1 /ASSEMBLY_ACC=CAM_ASM_000257 /TAXON_ID=200890 /ORGANISM="Paramoeba atlantica, Strain 621/1 / CCAP 1560/9" /LENGTH=748 /DNA_ID=CAMNT_0047885639 /DNA_START=74 /DNA_END=2320 /DNA_ORIENTATION=-
MADELCLADRTKNLGVETAFAVSTEARELENQGHKIYAFHIGDLNIPSPETMKNALVKAMEDGHTGYLGSLGLTELRQAVANHCHRERGVPYELDEVSIQPGGKPVIMKFLHAVMNPGDEVIVPTPGYPIYESLVRYLGGVVVPLTLKESTNELRWDWESLKRRVSKRTKIFIWNDAHNPTGAMGREEDRQEVVHIATDFNMWVLADEAYFHIVYDDPGVLHSIVKYPGMKERTVLLITTSKSWSCTGWRVGAAVGPKKVINMFGKLTCNDESMTSNFVQWACIPAFTGECDHQITVIKTELKKRRDLLFDLVNKIPGFSAPLPHATFYLWTDVTEAMKILSSPSYEAFRKQILHECKISFCTREHFGEPLPDERLKHIRLAFSGISCEDIKIACTILKDYMEKKSESFLRLPKVFCTRMIPQKGLDLLAGHFAMEIWPGENAVPHDVLLEKAKDCDGLLTLLTDKIDKDFLGQCPKLKVVSQMAVGYNNIDVEACTERGIAVTNTPDCLTETTAELTVALVFAVGRRIVEADRYVRDSKWTVEWGPSMLLGQDIHNHVYGIIGFGRIGQRVARMMKAFGARVLYSDLFRKEELEKEIGVEYCPLEDLIRSSDFISIHCNLTKDAKYLIDSEKISWMKRNCIFVNTARGAIVDQKALTEALMDKRIAGAGLDVFDQEPLRIDDPLLKLSNVVVLPHIGSASKDTRNAMASMAASGLLSYFQGVGEISHLVNREVLSRPLEGRGNPYTL